MEIMKAYKTLVVFALLTSVCLGQESKTPKGTYSIPPELVNFKKTQSRLQVVNAKEFGFDEQRWQSDPSRIIYHGGKYHVWMIDGFVSGVAGTSHAKWKRRVNLKRSWILYMTSKDSVHWTAEHYLPLGPKGSAYDLTIEQATVLHHEGKFYLFAEGWTSNIKKYGQMNAGIICLTANSLQALGSRWGMYWSSG